MVPEQKPVKLELAALREAPTVNAKAKIKEVMSVDKAWKIPNLYYGDIREVGAL